MICQEVDSLKRTFQVAVARRWRAKQAFTSGTDLMGGVFAIMLIPLVIRCMLKVELASECTCVQDDGLRCKGSL